MKTDTVRATITIDTLYIAIVAILLILAIVYTWGTARAAHRKADATESAYSRLTTEENRAMVEVLKLSGITLKMPIVRDCYLLPLRGSKY